MASEQSICKGDPVSLFGDGFTNVENRYHPLAMEGVGCMVCHQIADQMADEDFFSGNFQISDHHIAWSKFNPNFARTMDRRSGYLPEQKTHLGTSEFCAACHELSTDYFNAEGEVVSTPETLFPEQSPYKEWLESSFSENGTQCQDCHMHQAGYTKISTVPRRLSGRDGVLLHTFFTENTSMLKIIESVAQDADLDILDLDEAIENGQKYLSQAGEIETSWEKNTLLITIKVVNHTGHKLPTSIPLRRVFIHLTVYGETGDVIFDSGRTDDDGRIIGVDSDTNRSDYEPHYDTISSEEQEKVFETIHSDVKDIYKPGSPRRCQNFEEGRITTVLSDITLCLSCLNSKMFCKKNILGSIIKECNF